MRYILYAVAFLCVAVFQYGLLSGVGTPYNLIPLLLSVGIFEMVSLRFKTGIVWIVGSGIVADIHSVHFMGEVLIATTLAVFLAFVIEHYISHRSIYTAVLVTGAFVAISGVLGMFFLLVLSDWIPSLSWLGGVLFEMVISSILVGALVLLVPRIRDLVSRYIRI